MSRPILADTGPLYALADSSDQYHSQAREQSLRLQAEGLYVAVTYPTISEAYTLVLRRLGRTYAQRWLRELCDGIMLINPEPRDYQAAVTRLMGHRDQAITLFDAVAAVICSKLKMRVWTYDHHFDVMGVSRWG